jgi:1-acyl-sn-glycerol-3-phosphate acyltransferase
MPGPNIGTITTVLSELSVGPAVAAFGLLGALIGVPLAVILFLRWAGERAYRGEAVIGWARLVSIPYLRYFQRLTIEGTHLVPSEVGPAGLIVVSNHGAGLDPVALQAAMRHPIRWMMSAEMMLPGLAWAWRRLRVIPVCFDSRDAAALKTAIAHVAAGGVLGIFPEGAIERPARQLRPFSGGLRLILSRSRAPVLVALIDPGQPAETAYAALFKPTHARLRFVALIEPGPDGHGRDASERIFELLKRETGWPVNDAPAGTVDPATVERNLRAFASRDA